MIDANIIVGSLLGLFLIAYILMLFKKERITSDELDKILKGHK
jgi:hypothetical protein